MPIYGYSCQSCGHHLDALQKISDDPLKDCPECGQPELRKQLSAPRFRLKGQGWYETDFKTGDNKRNLHGADKPSSDAKPDSAGKSETSKKDTGKSTSSDSSPAT